MHMTCTDNKHNFLENKNQQHNNSNLKGGQNSFKHILFPFSASCDVFLCKSFHAFVCSPYQIQ